MAQVKAIVYHTTKFLIEKLSTCFDMLGLGENKPKAIVISILALFFLLFFLFSKVIYDHKKNGCDAVNHPDFRRDISKDNPNFWFEKAREEYRCREFFEDSYQISLTNAKNRASRDLSIFQLFIDEAQKVRDNVNKIANVNEIDNALDYSAFLLQSVIDKESNNYKARFDLGETHRLKFEYAEKTISDPILDSTYKKMLHSIDISRFHYGYDYDAVLRYSNPRDLLKAKIYEGYVTLKKGDFLLKNFPPTVTDGNTLNEEELEKRRTSEANNQYKEAYRLFDEMNKANPNVRNILFGKMISLYKQDHLYKNPNVCLYYRQFLNLEDPDLYDIFNLTLQEIDNNNDFTQSCPR